MIHMNRNDIEYLFGCENIAIKPVVPYADSVCGFLNALSKALREDREAKRYPDIQTFAFWIRQANTLHMKKMRNAKECRIGKGLVFHIAPSNVPINFAYTLVFGLLAGNANVVKVSSKRFAQTEIICRLMGKLTEKAEFDWVQRQNAVVLYDRENHDATDCFSAKCDMRVIWGGDKTIEQIRKSPLQPRSTEITFSDRYSFAVVSIDAIIKAAENELLSLAKNFYNDTYLMDQNACSSPHLIFWVGNEEQREPAQERFFEYVKQCAETYDLADVKVSEKYTMFCELASEMKGMKLKRYDNLVYAAELDNLSGDVTQLRGKFGLFFNYRVDDLEQIFAYVDDKKIQTCAVFGIKPEEIAEGMQRHHIRGIDRIVPIGDTLDIGVLWDGYNVIGALSRCVVI